MKKKVLCLIIVLCLILPYGLTLISFASDTDVSFSIGSMNAQKEENIVVTVNMNCTTSFSAANFVLTYDSNVLEYVPYYDEDNQVDDNQNCGQTILNSSGIPNATLAINSNTAGTIKIGYMSQKSVAGKSGDFLKFKFKVKSNASNGNSNISINATTLKDENGNNLTPEYSNGVISILSSIIMNESSVQMEVENEQQLSVSSENGTIFNTVTWTSSNSNIVRVQANSDTKTAKITAVASGTATITASVGGASVSCSVTVTEPEELYSSEEQYSLNINNPTWTFLPKNQVRSLSVTFNPTSAQNGKTVTWFSSNTNVATINSTTGMITAKSNGTSTITATDGTKSATYTLTVNKELGDIDEDSKITSYDAYRALVLYGNQASGSQVDENEVVILDVEKNGTMSSNDAYMILKYSVGLITSF